MSRLIYVDHIEKTFTTDKGSSFTALKDISISVEENEFVCILGPSGCGKSTLLRIISGLEKATSGKVYYREEEMDKPSHKIGMVFQNYYSSPNHMRFSHLDSSSIIYRILCKITI